MRKTQRHRRMREKRRARLIQLGLDLDRFVVYLDKKIRAMKDYWGSRMPAETQPPAQIP